jgi:hypothetical protein
MSKAAIGLISVAVGLLSPVKSFSLEGEPFKPSVPILWEATNAIPDSLPVYRVVPIPSSVISNIMTASAFTPLNGVHSGDKSMLLFQDKKDRTYMTRFLKIIAVQGWISYYDGRASGTPVNEVPSFEQAQRLALQYLNRLGADTNQILGTPRPFTEQTVTSFDKQGGKEIGKATSERGVILLRQADGIQILGSSFWIVFGNKSKPTTFEMGWPHLEMGERFKTATANQIVEWIKEGKGVIPTPGEDSSGAANWTGATKLTITKFTPVYAIADEKQHVLTPLAELNVKAEVTGRSIDFAIHCPMIRGKKVQ